MNLEKHNFHWKENFFYNFPIKRELFNELLKKIDKKQIVTISGLRRVGKTVLMKQLIDFLIAEKKVKRENILYYSFDEEQPKIEEMLFEFEKITNINKSKTKLYLFLDEIQKLDDWQNQVKYFYDNFGIKFIVSGSSSLFIRKKAIESLAGRSFDFVLHPLNFKEFLLFRKKEELLKNINMFQRELEKEFSLFLRRQFVEIIDESDEGISEYVKSILEKVIFIDIPKIFPIEHQDLLLRLMKIIASNPGMIIEYKSLSREIGINRLTLSNYLFYLEEAFLLRKTYNFSRNRLTSEKKSKKFYLSSGSFFSYLNSPVDESKLVENIIAIETEAKFFWRTPFKDEVDFILEKKNEIMPIELKYRNAILDKDIKGLIKFCNKNKINNGIVLTKDIKKEKIFSVDGRKIKIMFIPVWKWLLVD